MFAIVVNEKGGEQKRLEFDKPEVTIGRVQGNDIILPKGNVSKRHSRIVLKDGKFIIVDLKSTNGTYVNGRKITSPLVVKGSDKIYIGDFILSIEELQAGASPREEEQVTNPPQAPRKQPTVPPPPPRRAPQEQYEADSGSGEHDEQDGAQAASDEQTPPPPEAPAARPPRPSAPPPAAHPAPLPPVQPAPAARMPAARPASVQQPISRADLQAQPRPAARPAAAAPANMTAPSPPPAMARPAPAPVAARPAPAPVRKPAPAHVPAPAVDDAKRGKITEVMRELSTRLAASLGPSFEGGGVDATQEEDIWARAESAAADLLEQLSSDGSLPPGVDTDALLKDVVAETVGIGPLEELLHDDTVREVAIPRHDRIFIDRGGQMQLGPKWFSSPDAVTRAVERLLARAGRQSDLSAARANGALVEARIDGGLLLTAALPPLAARGPAVTIRRPRRNLARIADLVGEGMLSQGMADFVELALKGRRNIVVSGPAGSGRSTVLSALARAVSDAGERVVSVEESEELDSGESQNLWVSLIGRGQQARQAISHALRLKPDRLVVGDIRGAEALEMLGALAGGTEGALCAVQAGSPRDAAARLEAMARMAPEAPSSAVINDEIGRGVHLIVHLTRTPDGETRVGDISEVTPGTGPGEPPALQPVFVFKPDAAGGRFSATGYIPGWAEGAPPSTFRA